VHATVDHVRCRSHGGTDAFDNLVLSCAPCNNQRAARDALPWLDVCLHRGVDVDVAAVRAAIERALPLAA
jgi:HNH endonuclease